jgi:hypothetical protein
MGGGSPTKTERDSGQIAHTYKIEVVAELATHFAHGAQ